MKKANWQIIILLLFASPLAAQQTAAFKAVNQYSKHSYGSAVDKFQIRMFDVDETRRFQYVGFNWPYLFDSVVTMNEMNKQRDHIPIQCHFDKSKDSLNVLLQTSIWYLIGEKVRWTIHFSTRNDGFNEAGFQFINATKLKGNLMGLLKIRNNQDTLYAFGPKGKSILPLVNQNERKLNGNKYILIRIDTLGNIVKLKSLQTETHLNDYYKNDTLRYKPFLMDFSPNIFYSDSELLGIYVAKWYDSSMVNWANEIPSNLRLPLLSETGYCFFYDIHGKLKHFIIGSLPLQQSKREFSNLNINEGFQMFNPVFHKLSDVSFANFVRTERLDSMCFRIDTFKCFKPTTPKNNVQLINANILAVLNLKDFSSSTVNLAFLMFKRENSIFYMQNFPLQNISCNLGIGPAMMGFVGNKVWMALYVDSLKDITYSYDEIKIGKNVTLQDKELNFLRIFTYDFRNSTLDLLNLPPFITHVTSDGDSLLTVLCNTVNGIGNTFDFDIKSNLKYEFLNDHFIAQYTIDGELRWARKLNVVRYLGTDLTSTTNDWLNPIYPSNYYNYITHSTLLMQDVEFGFKQRFRSPNETYSPSFWLKLSKAPICDFEFTMNDPLVNFNYKGNLGANWYWHFSDTKKDTFANNRSFNYKFTKNGLMKAYCIAFNKFGRDTAEYEIQISNFVNTQFPKIQSLVCYPNPASNSINFSQESGEYEILSLTGQLIKKGNFQKSTINTSNLSNGFYFITVKTEQGQYSGKVIIER